MCIYFDIISNLQKSFKKNTKNSYFVYILPISSVVCSLHVRAQILFSEPFVNKFQTLCSFTPKHFSVYIFKNKDISFHRHNTTIKTRTFNIDSLLLSIPKGILSFLIVTSIPQFNCFSLLTIFFTF